MKLISLMLLCASFAGCGEKKSAFEYAELRPLEKDWGYTQAVKHGNTIYLSGSVSMDSEGHLLGEGDMAAQLKNALEDVKKTLAYYGADQSNIVKETIFTTDIEKLIAAYAVRAEFYKGFRFPPSSWVGVNALGLKGSMVEVEVIAELE